MTLRRWSQAVWLWWRRAREERELAEELEFHMERAVEANVRAGMTPADARRAAAHVFGSVERFKEEVRDERGSRLAEDTLSDVAYGLRSLRRNPGFALVVISTLALGIGATTAIFSVVNGVLLESLPYPAADRLVNVWGRFLPESGFDFEQFVLSPPEYFDYRAVTRTMEGVAAYSGHAGGIRAGRATILQNDGSPVLVAAAGVSANLFSVLGVQPALGRGFTADEDVPGGKRVVVVSDGLWRRAFGGSPLIGRSIRLSGAEAEVVGVMPPGFGFPTDDHDVWVPIGLDAADRTGRSSHYIDVIARLRADAGLDRARAEMETLMARWKAEYPRIHTGHFLYLRPAMEDAVRGVRRLLFVLMGAVGFVLLIVCANVANLMLARGESRQREVAVRSALGAGRARLVRQLLTEAALLAAFGSIGGLMLAQFAVRAILALGSDSIPRASNVMLDLRVLAFTLLLGILTAALFGVLPAARASATRPLTSLQSGGRWGSSGRHWSRFRGGLVAGQVALAFVVVVCAALMVRSFAALSAVDAGVRPDNVLVATISLPEGAYPDSASITLFHTRLSDRLRSLNGVQAATAISSVPLLEYPGTFDFAIEHRPPRTPGQPMTSGAMIAALPSLRETLGVPMLEGRFFDVSDRAGSLPVAVVNRAAARKFWPGANPIGQRIAQVGSSDSVWMTIVGVIEDVKYEDLATEAAPAWYVPFAQMSETLGWATSRLTHAIRTDGDPLLLASRVRDVVRELDAELPLRRVQTMESVISESLAQPRFTMILLGSFATLALVLGAVGLYGLLSYAVAQRTRELGIRMALGAQRAETARLVVRQALALVAAGVILGAAIGLQATGFMADLVFGVGPRDAGTFVLVAGVLFAAGLLATARPAIRAMRVDPIALLRGE